MKLAQLETGHKLGPYDVGLSPQDSIKYAQAVGRECSPDAAERVPPMAVIAAGLGKLIDELGLAGGTIHGSQGAKFERPITAGEKLSATAVLRGNTVRRGARFATLDTTITDIDGEVVASATSMVIVGQ